VAAVDRLAAEPAQSGAKPAMSSVTFRARHADGSTRWLSTTATASRGPSKNGRGIFGTVADVTETTRQRAAGRSNAQVHRDVWDSIPASAAVLNRDGVITEVNRAWSGVTLAGA